MNLLSQLIPKRGSKHKRKRVGRGDASGQGSTAGKGHKGQKARTGGKVRRGFEGGQSPLARRSPKFGFTNIDFKTTYEVVNLVQLDKLSGDVTPDSLKAAGLVKKFPVKVLGRGEIKKALNVKAHKFSKTAVSAIEKAGGKVEVIN